MKSILEHGQRAGGLSLRRTRQACFFSSSASARFVIATPDDRLDRTSSWTNNGTVQAQIMIVLVISLYDELQDANFVFHQQLHWHNYFARQHASKRTGQYCHFCRWSCAYERKPPTSTKTEATLDDRIDLLVSDQPEELYLLNERERETNVFLISNKINQVLKFPNKSTMVNGLIKNYSQMNVEDSRPRPCITSRLRKLMLSTTLPLDRHEVFLEDWRSCSMPNMLQISNKDQVRHFVPLVSMLQGHYRGGRGAGRATNQQSIHHVRLLDIHKVSIKELLKRGRRYGNAAESQKLKKSKRVTWIPRRSMIAERSWSDTSIDEQYQKRMHEQGYK